MLGTQEERKIQDMEQAFLLQFGGDEYYVRKKIGIDHFSTYGCPVDAMNKTGLFGILEALIDLGFTGDEIRDFYIHNHVEPYTDPYQFTEGIIEIVYGMSKMEIKSKYGAFFSDKRIEKIPNPNRNTQMLLSFCYDKDDVYKFISNKDDLCDTFVKNYESRYNNYSGFESKKDFPKIDGKLFRVVRFLVRQGYDFPELENLTNEQIKDILFKQTNGEKVFVLNKEYAREISDVLLGLVYFLKNNNYEFLNPEDLLNPRWNNIILKDFNDKQIILNRLHLEPNVIEYIFMLQNLNYQHFEISDVLSLCDKRVKNIELKYTYSKGIEHNLFVNRNILLTLPQELFYIIWRGYNHGFTFPDSDNLFNVNERMLKVIAPNGKEQLVVRNQFNDMLNIISRCVDHRFSVNLDQLFNLNQSVVEVFNGQDKAFINRERIMYMMDMLSLLMENGYHFKCYSNLFDESKPYIVSYDWQNQERVLNRKQIYKIMKLDKISDKDRENLNDSDKDLLSMINTSSIRRKLFEWLPYTAKKWIPSSAVIKKIPAEQSYKYFYNNNYERLKVLKDKYNANSYNEMEGIISIGYILGLFDSKLSNSERAMNYIIDYFLKKGVSANELHTTYGAIDLRKDYNKQFADFFMKHYAIDSEAFIEPDIGTNMTGELFERFDEVLAKRPEKRIKTRTINKLLTPMDAMASIINIKIDKEVLGEKAEDERYIFLAELLTKFGASKSEIRWAINLYERALAIDEQKVSIPNIEDLKIGLMKFKSHLKSDPQAFLSGRKTNCCSRYGGFAEDRLTHVVTDLNWRYVTFTSPNRTFFDGLVWYDKEEKVVCIDNVEGQFSKIDKNSASSIAIMTDTIIRYADGIYNKMNKLNIPCIKVNVGNDPGTASYEIFDYARKQKLIDDDSNPCNYPKRNNISTDAKNQFTITNQKILERRREQ